MPWAADRFANQTSLVERRTVMRAKGTNREQFLAATGKDYRFVADVPEQHGAISEGCKFDALPEIGSVTSRLLVAHADCSKVLPPVRTNGHPRNRWVRGCIVAALSFAIRLMSR